MTVSSQSNLVKPISFVFHNTNSAEFKPQEMVLHIRPEELTKTDTSRLTTHQTLGGAFVDSFGPGVPSVQISGHTGWGSGSNTEGQQFFLNLHQFVYRQWHDTRKGEAAQGRDPDKVKLIINDILDNFIWVVAPVSFVLKRNVSNPLLSYYQINLSWVSDDVKDTLDALAKEQSLTSGLDSFDAALNEIDGFANELANDINGFFAPITQEIQNVMAIATRINRSVQSVLQSGHTIVNAVTGNLIQVATGLSFTSSQILSAVISAASFPEQVKARMMQTRSAWLNLFCILQNIIKPQKLLPNYDNLFGASLCSSTAGGRPLLAFQNSNSLEAVLPLTKQPLVLTQDAIQSINQLNAFDAVLHPASLGTIRTLSTTITKGVRGA